MTRHLATHRLALSLVAAAFIAVMPCHNVAQANDAAPKPRPQTIIIGLDLSKSNPMVTDDAYAARAGAKAVEDLYELPLKSRVLLRTFGSYEVTSNGLKIDQRISSHAKPDQVAEGIATIIANVPTLVRSGKLAAQSKTNIVPFLETMSQVVDCQDAEVHVILLTDGFEDSEYAHLTSRGGRLPAPSTAMYKGCASLTILGIGQGGGSPSATQNLREEWRGWAKTAGFEHYAGLYDW
ncbi:MAG: hypothetical protein GC184_02475 [Rhizobiales bacterium]|nr:hypothetical protein [Hyphomicrobiales bacterium]